MNTPTKILIGLGAVLLVAVLIFLGVRQFGGYAPEKEATVATTIFPLFDITQQIGGEEIEVIQVLPTGASPHTYEPTTAIVRDASRAQVLYAIGSGLDEWAVEVGENAGTDVVELTEDIELIDFEGHDEHEHAEDHEEGEEGEYEGHSHSHEGGNPHIWLSGEHIIQMAELIEEDLSVRFPDQAETFEVNLQAYITEVQATDEEIKTILKGVENPNIITFHDSFPYFAEAYGLELVGTFEPSAGQEPTPRYLEELQEAIDEAGVNVVYSEPQLGTAQLKPFVDDIGAEIVELDPLGGAEGRATLMDLLLFNARTIAQNQ